MSDDTFRLLIEAGDLQGVKAALVSNPDLSNQNIEWFLNQTNESDPLHYVCDCVFNEWLDEPRALELAALLIDSGAFINGTPGRESPLIASTSLGTESIATLLIDAGANLEASSVFGARALHWAAAVGLPSSVEKLIQQGAELEARCTEFNSTPLYWAVVGFGPHGPNRKRDPLSAAKALLDAGAKLDTANKDEVTALQCAQQFDSTEMHDLLTQYSTES